MDGEGPFLWFREGACDGGFRRLPRAGFCVSVFTCIWKDGQILLGKYGQHEAWMGLAGLDPERVRRYGAGWTLPGTHLRLGEDPREGAQRVLNEVLGLDPGAVTLSEPLVASAHGPHNHPEIRPLGNHFDIWFFSEANLPPGLDLVTPPWYGELAFLDPGKLGPGAFGREHHDVIQAFLDVRGRGP